MSSLFILDTPPSSIESLNIIPVSPITMDPPISTHTTEPHITVVDGHTRIQDFAPPPDLTSDLMQNEINHYQIQKANVKPPVARPKFEDEGIFDLSKEVT